MGIFKDVLSFAKGLITDPERVFREIAGGGTKAALPIAVYIACVLVNSFFMTVKPPDFPAEFARLGLQGKSFLFYFFTDLSLGTIFAAVTCALILYFLRTFSAGKMFLKALLAAGAVSAPAAAAFYAGSVPVFLVLAGGMLLFIAGVIGAERRTWWRFFKGALALNLISAAVSPLEFAAVYLRAENLFIIAELAAGLWTIVLLIKMAGIFTGASIPQAMLSLAAGLLCALLFFSSLYGAGVISKEIYEMIFIL